LSGQENFAVLPEQYKVCLPMPPTKLHRCNALILGFHPMAIGNARNATKNNSDKKTFKIKTEMHYCFWVN